MPLPSLVPRDTVFFDLFNQPARTRCAPRGSSSRCSRTGRTTEAACAAPRAPLARREHRIEVDRIETHGDRLYRDAVASLFANGIDPMVVIRWKDLFGVLERAVDATETAAHILEGIVIKNA